MTKCECINHLNCPLNFINKHTNCTLKLFNKTFICIKYIIFCYLDFIFRYRLHIFSSRNKIFWLFYIFVNINFNCILINKIKYAFIKLYILLFQISFHLNVKWLYCLESTFIWDKEIYLYSTRTSSYIKKILRYSTCVCFLWTLNFVSLNCDLFIIVRNYFVIYYTLLYITYLVVRIGLNLVIWNKFRVFLFLVT